MRWAVIFVACFLCVAFVRTADPKYVIECYFVLDDKAIEPYVKEDRSTYIKDVSTDFLYFANLVNERLSFMKQYGLDIEIQVLKIDIDFQGVIYSTTYPAANKDNILSAFESWLKSTDAEATIGYDMAILLTGYELSGAYIEGYSHEGTICGADRDPAVSVVHFNGLPQVSNSLAKEVAKVLGAEFDGYSSPHIMRMGIDPREASNYYFAECSAFDIKQFIDSIDASCLLQTKKEATAPIMAPEFYDGKLLDPDRLCRRAMGDERSAACRTPNLYGTDSMSGDSICVKIYCLEPNSLPGRVCTDFWVAEGTPCDKDKICRRGKCIDDQYGIAKDVIKDCAYGDEPTLNNGKTCPEMIRTDGSSKCYSYSNSCCKTCAQYITDVKGCEYGDHSIVVGGAPTTCDAYLKRYGKHNCGSQVVKDICCESCQGYSRRKRAGLDFLTLPDGPVMESAYPVGGGDEDMKEIAMAHIPDKPVIVID
ncbi:A disintegrin and metalloproteinase with thrombospondin motifs 1 [Plakobranchus ocellatus]|uniref:A disintegrin and metalloproteinase with thrombospondin motifs 1 n=1 Tax=Plakobranchus ocellatus TaxID=259542 RepID=A0AAV4DSK3_9GAST|nr:A disintegrin and metalloproteinase with thrombospondin motifs 1 [Plakobranchus ocellatus]